MGTNINCQHDGSGGSPPPRSGEPPDSRPIGPEGKQRIQHRRAAAAYVRGLGPGFAGSLLALYVDADFNLLALDRLGEGSAAACGLKPYLLVRRGLELGATGFVLVHHAPDRTEKATAGEIDLTREIRRAGEDFEVHLMDHLILGADGLVGDVP